MFAWLKRLWERLRPYPKQINPPVIKCVDRAQAQTAAKTFAAIDPANYIVHEIAPTGSMAPLIPKAPGFMVSRKIPFANIRLGTVVTYWPEFAPGKNYLHRLVAKDALGYLASGDASPRTESWARITKENFEGEAVMVWHWSA